MSLKLESPVAPIDSDKGKSLAQAKFDRAQRAIRHFYRLRPNIEAFARVFTKNRAMTVEPTGGTSHTDGKRIWLRVDPELGDEYRHDKSVCGERDARLQYKCSACIVNENMLVALFHEIAHIVYESFEPMSDADRRASISEALAEAERFGVRGGRLDALREHMTERPPETHLEAANRISPFLFPLINGIEDARINALTMEARKGMRPMFEARSKRIFEDGIDTGDQVIHWRDQPGNVQVAVALSCYASGFYERDWFSDPVAEALDDEHLRNLTKSAVDSPSVAGVYRHSFPILERLRELGFCRAEGDIEPEPEPDPDGMDTGGDHDDQGDEGEDGSDGSGSPLSDPDDAPEPDTDDAPEPDTDEPGRSGDAPDAGADPDPDDERGTDDDDQGAGSDESDDDESGDEEDDEGSGLTTSESDEDGEDEGSAESDEPETEDGSGEGDPGECRVGDEPEEQDGTADEVRQALSTLCHHHFDHDHGDKEPPKEKPDEDIEIAIAQEEHFDQPSYEVHQLRELEYDDPVAQEEAFNKVQLVNLGERARLHPMSEQVMQQSLGKMRIAFSENRRGRKQGNLKSGKINSKVLGRRVPIEDERLFQKRTRPGKRDYFVVVGLDASYSTVSGAMSVIKSAGYAQAELLDRIGVRFEVWAHSGLGTLGGYNCDMFKIKGINERWNSQTQARLRELTPVAANLDGHTMEFYRKRLDAVKATDKILMYYTDGAMPAENYVEEKEILVREIRECKRRGYEVVGVGVGTDEPKKYGLDTVPIRSVEDVPEVVRELHRRLT